MPAAEEVPAPTLHVKIVLMDGNVIEMSGVRSVEESHRGAEGKTWLVVRNSGAMLAVLEDSIFMHQTTAERHTE